MRWLRPTLAPLALVLSSCGLFVDLSPAEDGGARPDAGMDADLADAAGIDAAGPDAAGPDAAGFDAAGTDAAPSFDAMVVEASVADASVRCMDNRDCADSEYCARPEGLCFGAGECAPRPTACAEIFAPVCGCDFVTYDNACFADAAGAGIRSTGTCDAADVECGLRPSVSPCPPLAPCFDDTDCGASLFTTCVWASCNPGGEGVCVGSLSTGLCYDQRQCESGESCVGAARSCPPLDGRCRLRP